jgi:soluble lytic murein transglycosylase-like protein
MKVVKLILQKIQRSAWPWTVNVEGKGFYFNSKKEAVFFVRKQLQEGKTSIDVGCMQINLKHHPEAFVKLEQAFNPRHNIGYAASFLVKKFAELGSWGKAIAHYHSANPTFRR